MRVKKCTGNVLIKSIVFLKITVAVLQLIFPVHCRKQLPAEVAL